jgi:hypothetical protein
MQEIRHGSQQAIHVGLGNIDSAFIWMERVAGWNDGWIQALGGYPFLDPLRADLRFQALLHRINLGS